MSTNHNAVSLIAFILSLMVTVGLITSGAELTLAELISTKLVNATTPLVMGLGFLYFLRGTAYDVLKDIFEEHNVAAAIFVAAVFWVLSHPFGG